MIIVGYTPVPSKSQIDILYNYKFIIFLFVTDETNGRKNTIFIIYYIIVSFQIEI